jgi:hypothetical protein
VQTSDDDDMINAPRIFLNMALMTLSVPAAPKYLNNDGRRFFNLITDVIL